MNAKREAVAGVVNLFQDVVELVGVIADYMQHWPEDFAGQLREPTNFIGARREEAAMFALIGKVHCFNQASFFIQTFGMCNKNGFSIFINHWANVSGQQAWIANG